MKAGRLLIALCLLLGIVALPLKTSAQDTDNFLIHSFDADYYLSRNAQKTSQMDVTEKIVAEFPDFDQNHGILRAIPKTYQHHTVSLQINSVKDQNGQPINFKTSSQNDNLILKIGNANTYVHGQQTYVIRYTMRNVINFQADHDELYWDVNGDQWPQAFDNVTAAIHIPADISSSLLDKQVCYSGSAGSTNQQDCQITRETDGQGQKIVANTKDLGSYQTLTFVLGFKKGTFEPGPEIAHAKLMRKIMYFAIACAVVVPPILAFALMFRKWRQFGNDPKGRGVIVPEYEPPKSFNSLTSDYLLQEKLRNLAFSAAIIELATKRYLTIYEVEQKKALRRDSKDYELELSKSKGDLDDQLKKVIDIIFGEGALVGARTKVSEMKARGKDGSLYKALKALETSLGDLLTKNGYFVKDPKKTRNRYLGWAGGLAFVGFFGIFAIWTIPLAIGIFLASAITFTFAFLMPARSQLGVETNDQLLGLRDYIKLAEAERLKFGQSPQGAEKIKAGSFNPNDPKMKVKLFETLLPYAMLFGLENDWAKQFNDIYKSPPDWYQGNWSSFNTGYLVGSIGNFTYSNAQSFSSPSSSSGSGFSGGFSGGGGGGGGGGGW